MRILIFFICSFLAPMVFAVECKNPKITYENAFPKLPPMSAATAMVQTPKDDSFWVLALREGEVVTFKNSETANAQDVKTMLNISSKVDVRAEMGMTGVALHPDYPSDNRLFVVYNNSRKNGQSTLASYKVDTKTRKADPASEEVLLTLDQEAQHHNGGHIGFDKNNYLYVTFGDGGFNMGDSQNLKNLYGSILRIDVSTSPYKIPQDNPFNQKQALCKSGKGSKNCPEIYAYGFRNPWRFSFDKKTGDLWVTDVGEESYEEINLVKAGKNYGWPHMEGPDCFDNKPCDKTKFVPPFSGYDYEGQQSIVGGYVYRGNSSPAMQGHYIFGDSFESTYYSVNTSSDGKKIQKQFNSGRKIVTLAEGNDGEIYIVNFEGDYADLVYRLKASCQ